MISLAPDPRTLIDELLETQRSLTAVERFAQKHERHTLPAQAKYYRDLIPMTHPAPGEQYAFAVNLDTCTGCKACVSACHSMNGLDEDEIWRNVGVIQGGGKDAAYQQTVTTACHHCVEPGCAEGCPTLAYEKDAETGIVRHLDDQCIGCQYCVLKCPYDVPKYSKKRGIVRKCDMCQSRLAVGEAPACVQACPNGAIRIETVSKSAVRDSGEIIAGAFRSDYTKPPTSYRTQRATPSDVAAADAEQLRLDDPHWPLVAMLLLTQAAAGMHCVAVFRPSLLLSLAALGALLAGMTASFTHLGRPLKAWRAVLGIRTSWMSREIVAFSIYAAVAGAAVVLPSVFTALAAAGMGLVSVFTSVMIYVSTQRPAWNLTHTAIRFFGTSLLLGSSVATLAFLTVEKAAPSLVSVASFTATLILFARWRWQLASGSKATRTIRQLLPWAGVAQNVLFVTTTAAFLLVLVSSPALQVIWATLGLMCNAAVSAIERYTFFATSAAPKMPGMPGGHFIERT